LFVTKQYQPFCVRTGGDALMKLQCSGLLPSIEVGLRHFRKWKRGKSLLSHHVQCIIPTFEALLRKHTYLFLERCRKSNNVWLRAWCSRIACIRHYSL